MLAPLFRRQQSSRPAVARLLCRKDAEGPVAEYPAWLEQPESEWPQQGYTRKPQECLNEVKKSKAAPVPLCSTSAHPDRVSDLKNINDVNRFSTLERLHRVTAWARKWSAIRSGQAAERGDLTTEELQQAQDLWLKAL